MDNKLEHILKLVAEYAQEQKQNETWVRGKDIVYYAKPHFNQDEYVEATKTLLRGWLGLSNHGKLFERNFSKEFNRKFGVMTNSGSSANLLMVSAMASKNGLKLAPKSKVIVPVAGFPTTLNPIMQLGFEPIFVDIDVESLCPNMDAIEATAKSAKAIMFAHPLGNCPDMERLIHIVKKHNLILLEDCCDALGSTYDGKPLGSFGDMSSCSFYPAHHMTMGEGGFVATDNPILEKTIRSLRDWGRSCYCNGEASHKCPAGLCGIRFSPWISALPNNLFDHKYIYDEIGYNLKPIEIQASIGIHQIEKLPEMRALRARNHAALCKVFEPYQEFFILPKATDRCNPCWFSFSTTLKKDCPFKKEDICKFFEINKIQTRPFFGGNLLLQPAYTHLGDGLIYPNSTYVMLNTFFIGVAPNITLEQIDYIKEILELFIKKYKP